MIGLDRIIENALMEDIHTGDLTTQAVMRENRAMRATLKAKENLVLAGIKVAARVFHILDNSITFDAHFADGSRIEKGATLAEISGDASFLLQGERVALIFCSACAEWQPRLLPMWKLSRGPAHEWWIRAKRPRG